MQRLYPVAGALAWGLAFLVAPAWAGGAQTCPLPPDPLDGRVLFADIETYAGFGQKRTGSLNGSLVAHWLRDELACAGLAASYQGWPFRRFAERQCALVVDGREIECMPLWFPAAASLGGVDIAAPGDTAGKVAVKAVRGYAMDQLAGSSGIDAAIAAGAAAVIAVNTVHQSLTSINADDQTAETPFPLPVVVAGGKDAGFLAGASRVDRLAVLGRDIAEARAANVVGELPGQDESRVIVVSTPMNGWFVNGGERGPGLALFLGLARWAARERPGPRFVFVATAGHEIASLGNHRFLDELAPAIGVAPENVAAWIHLGASIATWRYEEQGDGIFAANGVYHASVDYNDEGLGALLDAYLAPVGYTPRPEGSYTSGELALIMDRGFKTFGFYGAFDGKFHTRYDLADSTAGELLEPVARALASIIREVAARP